MLYRKILASVMTVTLVAALLYGCSGGNSGNGGESEPANDSGGKAAANTSTAAETPAASEPPAKITVIKPLFPGHVYFPDSELEKLVEKGANVDLTYETPPNTEYKTVLNVKLAGGDIPDIVNTFSPNDTEHNALIRQGVFLPLDDYLEKFPKLKDSFSEQIWEMMRNPDDGKIYGVPWLRDRGGSGIIIRKDWLDKLGLEMPKTLDELVEVLVAFRDGDPDGNGVKDSIPLTFKENKLDGVYPLVTMFGTGAGPGWSPDPADPNRLVEGITQPAMKEVLAFLRDLRKQGLLDPDFLIGKTLGFDKFKSGQVGVLITNLGDYRQVAVIPEMKAEILDPISNGDRMWSLAMPYMPISRTNQISSKSKNPEAALRYLEYQITEGFDYIQYGEEGKTYSIENGIKIPFPNDKKDQNYNTNVGLELLQPEWLFTDTEKYTKFVPKEVAEYIIAKLDAYEKYAVYDHLRPNIEFPTRVQLNAQLGEILAEGYSKILLDGNVDVNQTFDETLAKWKQAGGDRVVEEVNKLQTDKSQPKYDFERKKKE